MESFYLTDASIFVPGDTPFDGCGYALSVYQLRHLPPEIRTDSGTACKSCCQVYNYVVKAAMPSELLAL